MRKSLTNIRCYTEDNQKIRKLLRELSAIQDKDLTAPEVLRRINNSAEIKELLKKDAEYKRRLGK